MSSYSHSPSSSHAASAPTPSSQPTAPRGDNRATIVGAILGVVGAILVAGIIYATIRMKRRRLLQDSKTSESPILPSHGTTLDRSHLAARITPFGSPGGETPRFKHTPGADMRIATRRPDGAWQFTDAQTPFTPLGVSDLDPFRSPTPSSGRLTPKGRPKELEAKRSGDYRSEYDEITSPPPAYKGHDYGYGGYLPHMKN